MDVVKKYKKIYEDKKDIELNKIINPMEVTSYKLNPLIINNNNTNEKPEFIEQPKIDIESLKDVKKNRNFELKLKRFNKFIKLLNSLKYLNNKQTQKEKNALLQMSEQYLYDSNLKSKQFNKLLYNMVKLLKEKISN